MKIFVTGATGYIGAHLVNKLIEEGNVVHAFIRSEEKAKSILRSGVHLVEGDLLDEKAIRRGMAGCDEVYHLAAFTKVWDKNDSTYFSQNVVATKNVLASAKELGVRRVVVTSTAGVYGASMENEITENYVRTTDFFNEYESSKALAESWIKQFVIDGLDVVIVSPTRIYGPFAFGETVSITQMIEKYVFHKWRIIPGDGTKVGNYVFIDDVVQGHVLAMKNGRSGQTYLLGGENCDYNDFFKLLSERSGVKRRMIKVPTAILMVLAQMQLWKIPFGGTPLITPKWISKGKYHWKVSPRKAVEELGLQITPLDQGFEATVSWLHARNQKSE